MDHSVHHLADRMAGRLYCVPCSGRIDPPPAGVGGHLFDLAFCDGAANSVKRSLRVCSVESLARK